MSHGGAILSLWIQGRPRTKGSMKPILGRGGKYLGMRESSDYGPPWRKHMVKIITEWLQAREMSGGRPVWDKYLGAVEVSATFYFERIGPSAQKMRFPIVKSGENANGDLDKLERNLLDALTDAGLIHDDSQVSALTTRKRWAPNGLPPGVQVEVTRAESIA
jgi:hypothetical protein